jgi:hypothetical protein
MVTPHRHDTDPCHYDEDSNQNLPRAKVSSSEQEKTALAF